MATTALDKPINTDRQADKAARRAARLDRRTERIERSRDDRVGKLEARIKKIKSDAETRILEIDKVSVPLRQKLINFVIIVRQRKRSVTLATGTELEVYASYKVVAQDGDDKAAIAELRKKGFVKFVRIPPVEPELDRASLRQLPNHHVIAEMTTLSLETKQTLKIRLAEQ